MALPFTNTFPSFSGQHTLRFLSLTESNFYFILSGTDEERGYASSSWFKYEPDSNESKSSKRVRAKKEEVNRQKGVYCPKEKLPKASPTDDCCVSR